MPRILGYDGPVVYTPTSNRTPPLAEPKRGYRFGPENLLLYDLVHQAARPDTPQAHTTNDAPRGGAPRSVPPQVIDLGAGCGVLGLIAAAAIAQRGATPKLTLIERNAELAAFCRHNARALPHASVTVRQLDLRDLPRDQRAECVIANPPFFAPGAGRPSSNPMVHGATHALHGGLDAFVRAAERTLAPHGSLWLVYPAQSLAEVLLALAEVQLHACALHMVFARHTAAPYRVWVHATRSAGPLQTYRLSALTTR